MELGKNTVGRDLVSARYSHEYISLLLLGLDLVYTLIVGCDNFVTIRYDNPRDPDSVAGYKAINICTFIDVDIKRLNNREFCLTDIFIDTTGLNVDSIAATDNT